MVALTPAWTPLRPHAKQAALWRTQARFVAVAAGRGSGKTEVARRRIIRYLAVKKPWPNPIYFYALPTREQARRVAWEPLKALVPPNWIARNGINEANLTIRTVFGSMLYLLGLDKPQRAEGVQWDGGVIDESSDQRPGIFDRNLGPALTHRDPWLWRIGVPKRYGMGASEFKDFCFNKAQEFYTWPSSDILAEDQLQYFRNTLEARDFNEQYNASWEQAGGLLFYAFDEVKNVSDQITYNPNRPIVVGCDFNVDPMSWVIGHRRSRRLKDKEDRIDWFDELFIRHTNTRESLNELAKRYGEHKAGWEFYGDATGKARKTAASTSDYLQIKNDARFHGKKVFFPKANPARADRFAATNAMFCNAAGDRRCMVHPRCKNLINDLTTRAYKEGTTEPDDYGDIGHMTDAVGYPIHMLYPIRLAAETTSPKVYASHA